MLVNRSGLHDFIDHVIFGPCDEVRANLLKAVVELLKGHISFVYQVERIPLNRNLIYYLDIVDLTRRKQNKGQDEASEIHQCVHLERSLAMVELCPGAKLQAQLDGTAVERIDHLFKTNPQLFVLVELLNLLD